MSYNLDKQRRMLNGLIPPLLMECTKEKADDRLAPTAGSGSSGIEAAVGIAADAVVGEFIDKCRHLLPEPAPEVVGKLVEQLRGYDTHLRVCMGWTMRASELEVSSGMQEAQLADLKAAESFLANVKVSDRPA